MKIWSPPVSANQLSFIIVLVVVCALPHIQHISIWVSAFVFVIIGLRLLAWRKPDSLPGKLLLTLLTFGGVANVVIHQPQIVHRDTGVALLLSMLALKLLELRTRRDLYIVIFLCYFVIITQFLYNQQMWFAALMFLLVFCLTAFLYHLHFAHETVYRLALRNTAVICVQAIPIALAMFVLFPRFGAPLWSLGISSGSAVTGIGSSISPGSISELSRSTKIAFRVSFDADPPPVNQRYWRGLVLWDTDGYNWDSSKMPSVPAREVSYAKSGDSITYHVEMEPTQQRWLFPLELPAELPPGSEISSAFEVMRISPITEQTQITMVSFPEHQVTQLNDFERQRALSLPDNVTPRTRALAQQWIKQAGENNPEAVIDLALEHFNMNEFVYSLTPPALTENPVDQFLFESRKGFCEHYATSFVTLMRSAGIPARVIAGYQGGEKNPLDDYYIIRQSDAHAWAEVYLPGKGWERVDPTAAVSPERIEQSVDPAISPAGAPVQFQIDNDTVLGQLIRQFEFGMDALDRNWRHWIVGFNNKRQKSLLSGMGLGKLNMRGMGLVLSAFIVISLALLAIYLMRQQLHKDDPVLKIYRQAIKSLSRNGIEIQAFSGPVDIVKLTSRVNPCLRREAAYFFANYSDAVYGCQSPSSDQIKRLKLALKELRQAARRCRKM